MDKKKLPAARRAPTDQSRSLLLHIQDLIESKSQEASHDAVMTLLMQVPEEEQGTDWAQQVILLNGAHRKRANITFNWLNLLRDRLHEENRGDDFKVFTGRLQRLMHPYTIGAHGYALSFGGLDGAAIIDATCPLITAITSLGHEVFINSGTLLGAVRDGKLIPHDDDIDLAVVLRGKTVDEVAREWEALKDKLRQADLLDVEYDREARLPIAKLRHPSGVGVDIFPAWISGDRMYVWPHTYGELSVGDVFPLGNVPLHGLELPAPANPAKMLALNYGEGWRSPDPGFIFPWDAARKRFKPFIQATRRLKEAMA